jgi:hypothetical protein
MPEGLSPALAGLWNDARGNWEAAHACVQSDGSPNGAWVHAYLHRKEGDDSNAHYWYARAGRSASNASLDAEWSLIAYELLSGK